MILFWYLTSICLAVYCETDAQCHHDHFECEYFDCIEESKVCDATADCWYMEDELNCTECQPEAKKCESSQQCVNASQWCDGWPNCYDLSDETDCSDCTLGKRCNNTLQCVRYRDLCDGKRDCPDGSDEQDCGRCPDGRVHCSTGYQCVPECAICDGLRDCLDGSDEMFCRACRQQWDNGTIQCVGRKEPCNDYTTGVTVGGEYFNSTATHCKSKETKSEFWGIYNDKTCEALLGPCDKQIDKACKTGDWLCEDPQMETDEGLLQCGNGNFIPSDAFCNGNVDCNDDEVTDEPGFKCWGPKCKTVDGKRVKCCVLPQINIYDNEPQCKDKSDVCFLNGLFTCFLCDDNMLVVSQQQVCDGIEDCYGGSDERWCGGIKHIEKVFKPTANTVRCSVKKTASGCNQSTVDVIAVKCNGVPECGNMIDECANCEYRPRFCDVPCIRNLSRFGLACVGLDDPTCSERGLCPERFDCANGKLTSVESWKKCDGIIDCDDQSDEDKGLCNETRFYCLNKIPLSVDIRLVEDGIRQCSDGSDECLPKTNNARFADAREMIANTAFRACFWIIGFAASIGNIVVFFTSLKDLIRNKEVDNITKSTYIVLLSLSPADFLMGVYLIAISITSVTFSGKYCMFDLVWRSSTGCSILGMISILATMASSGTMAVMTAFRLLTILKPFIILKLKYVYISCICAWLLAIFLAVVPLFNYASGYFVYEAWFESRFFSSSEVTKQQLINLATQLRPFNSSSHSWHETIRIINASFPNQLKGVFGYYGETSVCMPRLYASMDDAAWQYSVFLLTLNFVFFIFMLVAYAIIYAESNKMAGGRNEQPSNKMQRRIFRLLLSDFCCWIPICVLGYLAVAGVDLPSDVYIVSAGFLLPINSALNPMLYSSALERFCGRFKKYLCSLCN